MLTLFAIPKAFRGHIATIQHNAIRSWTLLRPRPEIILIGDEPGTREVCQEFALRHVQEVERNEFGTPLVPSIFQQGQAHATNPLVCYINADILLSSDLLVALARVGELLRGKKFLLVGGKWDIESFDPREFGLPGWQQRLRTNLRASSRQGNAFEYFVFPRDLRWDMPPFAIGRTCHDNWLLYKVRKMGLPLVDASQMITAVHQRHDYIHYLERDQLPLDSPEARQNLRLRGFWHNYALVDATHRLTTNGLVPRHNPLARLVERMKMIAIYGNYLLRRRFYPYSLPFYLIARFSWRLARIILGTMRGHLPEQTKTC